MPPMFMTTRLALKKRRTTAFLFGGVSGIVGEIDHESVAELQHVPAGRAEIGGEAIRLQSFGALSFLPAGP
jgi:hypothetical protein